VYCLPHAGGAASVYLPWARTDGGGALELVPVEPPGRGRRRSETAFTRVEPLADELAAAIERDAGGGGFALFGHSLGALVAHETACRLAARRHAPLCLVVAAARPPGAAAEPRWQDLSDDGLIAAVAGLGGTPAEVLREDVMMRQAVPVLRADLAVLADCRARRPRAPLSVPIVALCGRDDPIAGPEWGPGWRSATAGRFRQRTFAGGHFFVHDHPAEVIEEIGAALGS
jgi:surfactin synthase thioesterase subunit